MANLHLHALLLFVSVLLRLSAADKFFLNCGAATPTTTVDGRDFVPDSSFLHHSRSEVASESFDHVDGASPVLYRTARIFSRPSSYKFEIKHRGTHIVRLHFHPFSTQSCDFNRARFHVLASGSVLLSDFHLDGGRKIEPLSHGCGVHLQESDLPFVLKEYFVGVDSDELEITFLPFDGSSFAFVNAIEVLPAPGMIPDVARLVDSDHFETLNSISKHEFEVLYRINTGGAKITPFNDTMWRHWVPDGEFLKSSSPSEAVHFGGRIQYSTYGANDKIAPFNVYATARVMKVADLSAHNSNMTWVYFVPHGYRYLVRLHFCDIASLTLYELYFNIFINGDSAYENFDLSSSVGSLAVPFYVDFVAEPDVSGRLSVTIAPSNSSIPSKVNGLLNGLEIMKMSNSAGNLDDGVILSGQGSGSFGVFVRLVLCGFAFVCLMVAGFIVFSRWRNASRVAAGWLPLPTAVTEVKMSFSGGPPAGKSVDF